MLFTIAHLATKEREVVVVKVVKSADPCTSDRRTLERVVIRGVCVLYVKAQEIRRLFKEIVMGMEGGRKVGLMV